MARIAVYDSGIGGLNILNTLLQAMPEEAYLYIADTKNAPYGTQTCQSVYEHSRACASVASDFGADVLVIACNTATAVSVDMLRKEFPFFIVGVEPQIKTPLEQGGSTLLMLTPLAASSERIKRLMKSGAVTMCADPLLTPKIEACAPNFFELAPYVCGLPVTDNVVLGCTHYIFLEQVFQVCRPGVRIFDGRQGVLARVRYALSGVRTEECEPGVRLYFSGRDESSKYFGLIFQ